MYLYKKTPDYDNGMLPDNKDFTILTPEDQNMVEYKVFPTGWVIKKFLPHLKWEP